MGRMAAAERLRSVNKKFAVGENPLEREQKLPVIVPTNQQQLEAMIKMLEDLYPNNTATPQQKQAMELWKFQVAQGTVGDQIKFDFVRRFYFWLLGRGSDIDHEKTSWGRANVAVFNPDVAAYIDQFAKKRMEFAIQLSLLKSRIPETLLGYYLYFKYIVNGKLEVRKDEQTGYSFYDISNEDFLQDWDLFKNVFDEENQNGTRARDRDGYADIAAGLRAPKGYAQFEGAVPYPATSQGVDKTGVSGTPASNLSLQPQDLQQKRVSQLDQSLHISAAQQKRQNSLAHNKTASAEEDEGTLPVQDASDLGGGTASSIAPQETPGAIDDSGFAYPFTPEQPYPGKGKAEMDERDSEWERRVRGSAANKTDNASKEMSGVQDNNAIAKARDSVAVAKAQKQAASARTMTHITGLENATNDLAALNARIENAEKRVDVGTPLRNEGRRREEGRDSSLMTPLKAATTAAKISIRQASKAETTAHEVAELAVNVEQQAQAIVRSPLPDNASGEEKQLRADTVKALREAKRQLQIQAMQKMFEESGYGSDASALAAEYGAGGSASYGSLNASELRDVEAIDENINRKLFEAAQAEVEAEKAGSDSVDKSGASEAAEESGNVSNLLANENENDEMEEVPVSSSSTSTSSHASDEKSGYVSVHSDTGDDESSLHLPPAEPSRYDGYLPAGARWLPGKLGKVFVEADGKHIVKYAQTTKEIEERVKFFEDNPELTVEAKRVKIRGREPGFEGEGLRMPFMKNFISLRNFDKKSLSAQEKTDLGRALDEAYSKLKYASYSDVTNLDNIAVWTSVMPTGKRVFAVQFYEGGNPGKKPVKNTPDLARANYMMRLRNEPGAVAIVNEFLGIKKATELRAKGGAMQMKKR